MHSDSVSHNSIKDYKSERNLSRNIYHFIIFDIIWKTLNNRIDKYNICNYLL